MTNKEIKNVMKNWYEAYKECGDESYMELYDAFHMIKVAGLMTPEQWNVVIKFDEKLFKGEA